VAVTTMSFAGFSSTGSSRSMSGFKFFELLDFLVIAGGGAGGGGNGWGGGGGGAGGYRCSITGENTGGGLSAERKFVVSKGQVLSLIIGAGGANSSSGSAGHGFDSTLGPIVAFGGGKSRRFDGDPQHVGGSGAGGMELFQTAGIGVVGQGYAGSGGKDRGGGGAGSAGSGGTPGAGVSSSITGSAVTRAVGGPGNSAGSNGAANTGTAGGGNRNTGSIGRGGSGLIVFVLPLKVLVTFSAGVTQSNSVVGGKRVYVVTATSTSSETVTIG